MPGRHLSHEDVSTIAGLEMVPGGRRAVRKFILRVHGVFAVNEEYWMEALPLANGFQEHVKSMLSSSAGYYAWHSTHETGFSDKFPEPFAAADMQLLTVTAPFHIDAYFHHRVPPNSPRVQSSPRRYCCSQAESIFLLRRSIVV